jgi:hypothetical protein
MATVQKRLVSKGASPFLVRTPVCAVILDMSTFRLEGTHMTSKSRRITLADLMSYFSGDYLGLDWSARAQAPRFSARSMNFFRMLQVQ